MALSEVVDAWWFGLPLFLVLVLYHVIDRLIRLPRVGRVEDRSVLVTGCGQGFGYEAVRRLDRLGCRVFAGCRKKEQLERLERSCSHRVFPVLMDVTDRESVRKAFEYVSSRLPKNTGLWGLVNNAGIAEILPFELQEVTLYRKIISTNLIGAIDVAMTFLPLIKRERGRILNVSSYSGRIALPVVASYAVSKYGLEAFTDGLRRSLRPYGCKALLVEPGYVKTNIVTAEQCVSDFEQLWRKANSPGDLTEDEEKILQSEKEKLFRLTTEFPRCISIDDVIDAYEHALFGAFPRARYAVGMDAKLMIFMQSLPEFIADLAIGTVMPAFRCRIRPN